MGEANTTQWGDGKGMSTANFTVAQARLVGVIRGERRRVGRWSGFKHEWSTRGASTFASDTGKQAGAWRRGCTRRPRGAGARDPFQDNVASSIPPFPFFLQNSSKI